MKNARRKCSVNVARWASYAAAGAATAGAVSEAEAQYTYLYSGPMTTAIKAGSSVISLPQSVVLRMIQVNGQPGTQGTLGIFFNHNVQGNIYHGRGAADNFRAYAYSGGNYGTEHVVGLNAAGKNYMSRLGLGIKISPQNFVAGTNSEFNMAYGNKAGNFKWGGAAGATGYMAFEFNVNSSPEMYGWVKLENTTGSPKNGLELLGYAYSTDPNFATGQIGSTPFSAWTGATNTAWAISTNWSGAVPGATSGTTNTDRALFNQNPTNSNSPLNIDLGRNLQNITIDNGGGLTTSLTIGTTTGNALLLTSGGAIATSSTVANPQYVNAPLILEGIGGQYAFSSNASTTSATLSFSGPITAGAASGTTTLILGGTNTGPNTISGTIANGGSGATLGLSVSSGLWVLTAANTYTGATTVAGGALQIGNGSSGSLGATPISITGGQLSLAAGGSIGNNSISITGGQFSLATGGGSLGNASISVSTAGTFAAQAGAGTVSAGSNSAGTSGATLSVGSGGTFSMVDGAIGTFNLLQQTGFNNAALTLSGGTLNFDLGSGGADKLALGVGQASVAGTNTVGISTVGTSLASGTYPLVSAPNGGLTGTFQFAGGSATEYVSAGTNYYLLTLKNSSTVESVSVAPSYSNFIIYDAFVGNSGTSFTSHMPNVNVAGGTYVFQGSNSTSISTLQGNGTAALGPDLGVALPISSNGSYTKPTVMTISGGLQIGTTQADSDPWRGIGLGFYPAVPVGVDGYNNFFGVVLGAAGQVQLVEDTGTNGLTKTLLESVPWSGVGGAAFSTSTSYTLTYTINTSTGAISNVSLSGSNADFSAIDNDTNDIFTNANTNYAGFTDSSHNFGQFGYISNFQLIAAFSPPVWTGTSGTSAWADAGNWQNGLVPGSTTGTTDTSTALFNLSTTTSPLTIDTGRNLMNITFDTSAVSSNTIGTTGGNALLLTSGGTIQTTPTVANPQVVNAPLVLEGNYAFASGATASGATLSFGGGIHPAATSGVTTLTLGGSNTGANTLSGVLADNGAGKLALAVGGIGVWVLNGSTSTFSGGTTIASGATLELAGSASALGLSQNISNAGSLMAAGGNQSVGTITGSGNVAVTSGTLTAYQIRQNSLTIGSGATVSLVPSGSGSTTHPALPNNINFSSSLTSLSIASSGGVFTGTLDIGNNGLVIAYGNPANDPYSTVDKMIESGYNGGVWGGKGITSTLAQAGVAQNISTPLNIGLIDFTPGTGNYTNQTFIVFEGQTVTTNAILVRLTYMDDIVLAGDMAQNNSTSDALLFAANFGSGTTWAVGDLTHDGMIDSNDALLFAANFTVGLPSLDGSTGNNVALASGEAAVPEPASLGLLAFGAVGLLAVRRARNRKAPAAASCLATAQTFVPDLDSAQLPTLAAHVARE